MAPFRNTMCLIDCNASKLPLLMHDPEVLSEAVGIALFWSNIKKACDRVASPKVGKKPLPLLIGGIAVYASGFNIGST
jgi:hypothetical protein